MEKLTLNVDSIKTYYDEGGNIVWKMKMVGPWATAKLVVHEKFDLRDKYEVGDEVTVVISEEEGSGILEMRSRKCGKYKTVFISDTVYHRPSTFTIKAFDKQYSPLAISDEFKEDRDYSIDIIKRSGH